MDEKQNLSKKFFLLMTIVAATIFLTGCTWFDSEEGDSETESTVDEVTVIEDDSDDEPEEEVIDDVEEVDEDVDEEVDDEIEEDEDEDTDDDDMDEEDVSESGDSVGDATSANGAVVNAYSYQVAGGKLNFSWKVDAADGKYPKAEVARMSDNNVVVTFPSLTRDSVAKEEKTTPLGGNLPELTWMPVDGGSKYEFAYESEKDFMLKTEDRGEDGRFVVVVIDY